VDSSFESIGEAAELKEEAAASFVSPLVFTGDGHRQLVRAAVVQRELLEIEARLSEAKRAIISIRRALAQTRTKLRSSQDRRGDGAQQKKRKQQQQADEKNSKEEETALRIQLDSEKRRIEDLTAQAREKRQELFTLRTRNEKQEDCCWRFRDRESSARVESTALRNRFDADTISSTNRKKCKVSSVGQQGHSSRQVWRP
jgi:chromosome segregation ATPase